MQIRFTLVLLPLSIVGLAGCGEIGNTDQHPPPRTVAALEHGLAQEEVGVSANPPVRRAPPEFDDADDSAVRLFHDVLAPYGKWIDDSRLGLVWIPAQDSVGDAFVPYATHGRWTHRAVTTAENRRFDDYVWLSDLPWGWVTFHYGRWAYTGDRGWAWVAGRRYSGAWVDWRAPAEGDSPASQVVGWGPTPPAHVWRISPGVRPTRARIGDGRPDPRVANLVPVPYLAFATPYSYVRSKDLFATDLPVHVLPGNVALSVAHATSPAGAPRPEQLGIKLEDVPQPPTMDRGLQQAWMLATPANAMAVGAGPELGPPPRLRTWVAGGPRWAVMR